MDTQASSFYGHVTLGLRIHVPYFKSTQCFQNMFFLSNHAFIWVHFGRSENFHSIYSSGVYIIFSKTSYDQLILSKKSWKLSLFTSMLFCFFLARQFFIFIIFFFLPFFFFSYLLSFLFPLFPLFKLFIICSFPLSSFLFFYLKRSCGRGHTLPTYV